MIKLENVSKKFGTGVYGLADISFTVDKGEFVFLIGPTGAGKTTIFRLLIKESDPSNGSITVDEWDLTHLPKNKIPQLRKKIGVVFQDLKLLVDRTIYENILLPLDVVGVKDQDARERVESILTQVGIIDHKDKFPVQLSGGELQRAAIARALVLEPDVLLADEPTGNLDAATSWEIVKLLSDINEKGTTVIMATHNNDIVKSLKKRVIKLDRGNLINDEKAEKEHAKESKKEETKKEDKEEKTEKNDEKAEVKE